MSVHQSGRRHSLRTQPSAADTAAVEVGVKFRPTVMDGYRDSYSLLQGRPEYGTHVGNFGTSAGALLGTATFASETATGWQQAALSQPVAVTCQHDICRVVSHEHRRLRRRPAVLPELRRHDWPPSRRSPRASAGRTAYTGTAAASRHSRFQSTNYWVDLVFVTSSPAPAPSDFSR